MTRPGGTICVSASLAALCGLAAAVGGAWFALAGLAAVLLLALGAVLPAEVTRAVLLLALVLTPEATTGLTYGLQVQWSAGLTLPNFLIPALAAPLMCGAWLAGKPLLPRPWPRLALWTLTLLGWGILTLLPPWLRGDMRGGAGVTVLAHVFKLALFIALGMMLAQGGPGWQRRAERLLLFAIAVEAALGLAQAARWLPVFSPLAEGGAPRATGTFYDANMYAVLVAWALLWLLSQPGGDSARRRWGSAILALALAVNLAAASSRAGFLALAAGTVVLLAGGEVRAVARAALLLTILVVLFPARTWQRVHSAAAAVDVAWRGHVVAPAAAADAATTSRLESMREALRQIAAHPLFGVGFGRALYLGVAAIGDGPVRAAHAGQFHGAQDMPLTVLAETGPVGLALFLLAFGAPLRRLREARRNGRLPLLAGYAGLLVASLTLEALWNARLLALLVFLTAALGIGVRPPRAQVETDMEAA